MPKLVTVERDYTQIGAKFDTLGPLTESLGMVTKGCRSILIRKSPT